jgi:anti-sigma B factor antagonist
MLATVTDRGHVLLVGRLDVRGSGAARDALHLALATGVGELVVDLSGVELLDATGLGVLVDVHRRAKLAGRRLVLLGVPPRIARLLAITRLNRILTVEAGPVAVPA